jgi:hypothetical protein
MTDDYNCPEHELEGYSFFVSIVKELRGIAAIEVGHCIYHPINKRHIRNLGEIFVKYDMNRFNLKYVSYALDDKIPELTGMGFTAHEHYIMYDKPTEETVKMRFDKVEIFGRHD